MLRFHHHHRQRHHLTTLVSGWGGLHSVLVHSHRPDGKPTLNAWKTGNATLRTSLQICVRPRCVLRRRLWTLRVWRAGRRRASTVGIAWGWEDVPWQRGFSAAATPNSTRSHTFTDVRSGSKAIFSQCPCTWMFSRTALGPLPAPARLFVSHWVRPVPQEMAALAAARDIACVRGDFELIGFARVDGIRAQWSDSRARSSLLSGKRDFSSVSR